jgi:hypothetical protein
MATIYLSTVLVLRLLLFGELQFLVRPVKSRCPHFKIRPPHEISKTVDHTAKSFEPDLTLLKLLFVLCQ